MSLIGKLIFGGIPILCVLTWFLYLQINGRRLLIEFFKNEISTNVIKSESFYGRTEEYHLENGMKLYFSRPVGEKILIGDSVSKDPNSYVYHVYRKDAHGFYNLWATYDINITY